MLFRFDSQPYLLCGTDYIVVPPCIIEVPSQCMLEASGFVVSTARLTSRHLLYSTTVFDQCSYVRRRTRARACLCLGACSLKRRNALHWPVMGCGDVLCCAMLNHTSLRLLPGSIGMAWAHCSAQRHCRPLRWRHGFLFIALRCARRTQETAF